MTRPSVKRALRTGDVAEMAGVSTTAVSEWADRGAIPSWRTPGGQRRFKPEDVEAFLKTQEPAPKAATA